MKIQTLALLSLISFSCSEQSSRLDLAGNWQFTTDSTKWNGHINLPGSMASNGLGDEVTVNTDWTGGIVDSSYFKSEKYAKYRQDGNVKVPFWLQPVKYYKGVAWYKKTVNIPEDWKGQDLSLFLECCHWETRLWVDDKEVGMRNALGAPHKYDLTDVLTPGEHTLTLRIDNRIKDIDPGENSHSISDHTQGNWNGVVGDMFIERKPSVNIAEADIYPDTQGKKVIVKAILMNRNDNDVKANLELKVGDNISNNTFTLEPGENEVVAKVDIKEDIKLWDEFSPNLYDMTLSLSDEEANTTHSISDKFGFRDFKSVDGKLTINDRQVFLRGTLDCAAFPKTGYPPTDVDSWRKIYTTCKNHGLNHIRFHSWCPPKAAFVAADELGMYLEIECSSWANQSTTIGDGRPLDKFIIKESEDIVAEYGNHPSFVMLMYGNEPAGAGSHEYLTDFVSMWKERDNRRLYCSSAGWPNLPVSDFLNDTNPRIQAWGQEMRSIINAEAPRTNYDWSGYVGRFNQPMVSHEIGQWCVYPNFKEIEKYDGVMRARNFEIFKETLAENGMEHLADSFLLASGKLQALCYKADIEAALRTKDFGGFQLLGLYDFPGQGTALVGVLDAFWEEKGYITPEEYKRFCNSTVPLARFPKLIYTNDEQIIVDVEISHFGAEKLNVKTSKWILKTKDGHIVSSGELNHDEIPVGNCFKLGTIKTDLASVDKPSQLTMEVQTGEFSNSWNLWCYPSSNKVVDSKEGILMTDRLTDKALKTLNDGGKVLLSLKKGTLAADMGGNIKIGFSSIFWNTAWTLGQGPHTLGILCNPEHPALKDFPTEYYSDYQWWDAMSHSNAIEVSKVSENINPVVRVIDDWFTNRPLALVFEVKVGNGKLLVSGIDFWDKMETRPEARQMLYSLMEYMSGNDFNPVVEVSSDDIKKMF